MSKLSPISYKECANILVKLGYVLNNSNGRHRVFVNVDSNKEICVPDHKEIRVGTLRSIIRDSGLSVEEFMAYKE